MSEKNIFDDNDLNFDQIIDELKEILKPAPEVKVAPAPDPEPEPEPEPDSEPETEPETEPDTEPEAETEPELPKEEDDIDG